MGPVATGSADDAQRDCLVCQEHLGEVVIPGGPLAATKLTMAFHIPPIDDGIVYLGHLLVTPFRHVADFAGLDDAESGEVGVQIQRWSAALKRVGAERVYIATIGHAWDHLHVHLLPRWPETPREVRWHAVDEWEGARRGGFTEAAAIVEQLRSS